MRVPHTNPMPTDTRVSSTKFFIHFFSSSKRPQVVKFPAFAKNCPRTPSI